MKYKIFAKSKDGVYVDYIYSTFFKDYEQGDILIKEGLTIEFIHHGMNVYDSNMCHNYKIENGKVVETTQEDKLLELSSRHQEPTEIEIIQEKISILEAENEKLKVEQEQQNEEILVNMLANTEMFEMILGMMPMTLSEDKTKSSGGSRGICDIYASLIEKGVKTINDVPVQIVEQVKNKLEL